MEPNYYAWVFVKGKGLFQKWKKNFGVIYQKSQFGIERLEIYSNEQDFLQAKHGRTILLSNCISIRYVNSGNNQVPFAVQLSINDTKNGQVLLGTTTEDEAQEWQDALCRAAFPDQYAKVTGPLLLNNNNKEEFLPNQNGPPHPGENGSRRNSSGNQQTPKDPYQNDDNTYDTPWDVQQVRVLLISTPSSHRLGISEGAYDLSFGADGVILKSDGTVVEAWNYKLITWFGYGSSVCSFETEGNQTFEFKCARPDYVFERLRSQIKLKHCSSERNPPGLKQAYFAHYAPLELIPQHSPRRTIFAPRASIDTALPGFFAKKPPLQPQRQSISPISIPIISDKSIPIDLADDHERQNRGALVPGIQDQISRTKSLPLGQVLITKNDEKSPGRVIGAATNETSFGKRKGKLRSLFSSRKGNNNKTADLNESLQSDERVEDWSFQSCQQPTQDFQPGMVPIQQTGFQSSPAPLVPESYVPGIVRPLVGAPQENALLEQLNRRLAERKETQTQMPPPFPSLQEEPEPELAGAEHISAPMPDVVDVNFRRSVFSKAPRFRDSVTSEPGNVSPRYFSVRNATAVNRPPPVMSAVKETTFDSPAHSPKDRLRGLRGLTQNEQGDSRAEELRIDAIDETLRGIPRGQVMNEHREGPTEEPVDDSGTPTAMIREQDVERELLKGTTQGLVKSIMTPEPQKIPNPENQATKLPSKRHPKIPFVRGPFGGIDRGEQPIYAVVKKPADSQRGTSPGLVRKQPVRGETNEEVQMRYKSKNERNVASNDYWSSGRKLDHRHSAAGGIITDV